jgi:hypothetical protein
MQFQADSSRNAQDRTKDVLRRVHHMVGTTGRLRPPYSEKRGSSIDLFQRDRLNFHHNDSDCSPYATGENVTPVH